MIRVPTDTSVFQFVVVSALRAAQLTRGCVARVDGGHKVAVTAQLEVSARLVSAVDMPDPTVYRTGGL